MIDQARTTANRFEGLDGARAFAALLVVIAHVTENWARFEHANHVIGTGLISFAEIFKPGVLGVFVFFLISGFVVPYSIKGSGLRDSAGFLLRRSTRIGPMLWVSIPFGAVTTHWLWGKEFGDMDWLLNATLTSNFFDRPFAQGLYWSLQVEVFFYLIVAVLILFFRPQKISVAGFFLILIAIKQLLPRIGFDTAELVKLLVSYTSIILIGWLIRTVIIEKKGSFLDRVVMVLVLIYYLAYQPFRVVYKSNNLSLSAFVDYSLIGLALTLFLLFLYIRHIPWVLLFLGKVSYSIYLIHPIVMYALYKFAGTNYGAIFRTTDLLLSLVIVLIATVALSAITWRWIEYPSQQWAKTRNI